MEVDGEQNEWCQLVLTVMMTTIQYTTFPTAKPKPAETRAGSSKYQLLHLATSDIGCKYFTAVGPWKESGYNINVSKILHYTRGIVCPDSYTYSHAIVEISRV